MANALYGLGREAFLDGNADWAADDFRVILVDVGYVVSIDVHNALDDVGAGTRVATSSALSGKTSTLGVADASDVTYTAITGDQITQVVLYRHTGVESTSALIAYWDSGTGLPFTPTGGNIDLVWDNGANKIFKL